MSQRKINKHNVKKIDLDETVEDSVMDVIRKRQLEKEKGGEFIRRDDRTLILKLRKHG